MSRTKKVWTRQPQIAARPKHGGVKLAYSAATLADAVGATSTLAGSPSTVANELGKAIRIDSTAKSVAFTNRGPYFKESFNLSFVFTTNGSVLNGGTYLTLAGSSGSNNKIDIYTLSGGTLRADIYSNAGSAVTVNTAVGAMVPFKSYVVTLSYNRATNVSQWWINGTASGSASTTVLRDNEAATVTFGGAGAGASGNIDLNFVGVESVQNDAAATKVSIWDRFFAPLPRRRRAPVTAGGAPTAALTNNLATTASGILVPALSLATTGNTATASAGTPVAGISLALTGNSTTASAGTPVAALSLALTGNAATSAVGSVSPDGSSTVALGGNAATSTSGTVSLGITVALTGNAATASVGTTSPAISLALAGLAGTSSAGIVVPGLSTALTGNGTTSTAGTVAPGGDVTLALTGNAATASVGTLSIGGPLTDAEFRQMYDWLQDLYGRQLLTVGTFIALK